MKRVTRQFAFTICLLLSLTSCGEQSKQYASSSAANAFFTVPNEWREISFEKLSEFEKSLSTGSQSERADSVIWQIAFTPLKKLELADVYSIQTFEEPIVFARVRTLTYQESNEISYNVLRDIVVPFQTWTQDPSQAPTGFSVISDAEVIDQGAHGIRSVFTFDDDGVNQTFDQVTMVSDDRRTLYILVSRCTTVCYQKNKNVVEDIVKSFTLRGKK